MNLTRQKVFIINEEAGDDKTVENEVTSQCNVSVETYTDYKKLLYKLHTTKKHYKVGIIHENGSKSKPSTISNFVQQVSPGIKIIIYTSILSLRNQLKNVKI